MDVLSLHTTPKNLSSTFKERFLRKRVNNGTVALFRMRGGHYGSRSHSQLGGAAKYQTELLSSAHTRVRNLRHNLKYANSRHFGEWQTYLYVLPSELHQSGE